MGISHSRPPTYLHRERGEDDQREGRNQRSASLVRPTRSALTCQSRSAVASS
jgi:hypothetical protein